MNFSLPKRWNAFRISILMLLNFLLSLASHAQTGIAVPSMVNCDNLIANFMNKYEVPGAAFTLAKNGKIVYSRAFGKANLSGTELAQPYHLFRIASISKPITSIAIMKLVEQGSLGLDDLVFGAKGVLQGHPEFSAVNISDPGICKITVNHLLEHAAGWNREVKCFPYPTLPYSWKVSGCDPISAPLFVSQQTGTGNPVSKSSLINFLLEKGLDFRPGTDYAYSNIGYLILGKIIEVKTGLTYEQYVKDNVLSPIGICDMHLGKNLLADKREREAEYHGNGSKTLSAYGTGKLVPWEYGGYNIEAMDAHGGWLATSSDLVKLLAAVDDLNSKPCILTAASISKMVSPSANNPGYAKGWSVNRSNNWWHTGSLDGTASFFCRTNNGYTWAIILNKRITGSQANNFWKDLDALPWNCISSTSSFPSHDLMLAPTENCSNLKVSEMKNKAVTINWNNGNGDTRILLASNMGPINSFPLDGVDYEADASFGLGNDLGNGTFVVYSGNGNAAEVDNLNPDLPCYFRVFEFNKNSATGNYPLYKLCNSEMATVLPLALAEKKHPMKKLTLIQIHQRE
ncbi:MAG: beta-lactamase family protein [Bacteroidetes bacterium]|nr:beta-lactamase family protein [Bacteroidota bacterium]